MGLATEDDSMPSKWVLELLLEIVQNFLSTGSPNIQGGKYYTQALTLTTNDNPESNEPKLPSPLNFEYFCLENNFRILPSAENGWVPWKKEAVHKSLVNTKPCFFFAERFLLGIPQHRLNFQINGR